MGEKSKKQKSSILKIIIILAVFLIIFGVSYFAYYVHALSQIQFKDINVNSLQINGLNGFSISGNIEVYNPSLISLEIKGIDYIVVLDADGSQLASGKIIGKKIPAKDSVSFPFSNKISWKPTADLAYNLITSGNTDATIKGTVYVTDWPVKIELPFEKKIELGEYIKKFIVEKVEEAKDTISKIVNDVAGNINIDGTISAIAEGINEILG